MNPFTDTTGPWLHLVELDMSAVTDRAILFAQQEAGRCVRIVRGKKMLSESRLFDEFAAAYQFPYYFGENWDALDECINDLSWMPATSYLTVVSDADLVLSEAPSQFRTFAELLGSAGREWSEQGDSKRPWAPLPHPFHVVLQVGSSTSAKRLANLLATADIDCAGFSWA
jgi:RNAse (barnase) inhibitor barstar